MRPRAIRASVWGLSTRERVNQRRGIRDSRNERGGRHRARAHAAGRQDDSPQVHAACVKRQKDHGAVVRDWSRRGHGARHASLRHRYTALQFDHFEIRHPTGVGYADDPSSARQEGRVVTVGIIVGVDELRLGVAIGRGELDGNDDRAPSSVPLYGDDRAVAIGRDARAIVRLGGSRPPYRRHRSRLEVHAHEVAQPVLASHSNRGLPVGKRIRIADRRASSDPAKPTIAVVPLVQIAPVRAIA